MYSAPLPEPRTGGRIATRLPLAGIARAAPGGAALCVQWALAAPITSTLLSATTLTTASVSARYRIAPRPGRCPRRSSAARCIAG